MILFKNSKYKGFTLAELLLAMTILGIIASYTIPGLIQNTEKARNRSVFKQTYSALNQATKRIMIDNGGTMKGITITGDHGALKARYAGYLNLIKNCDWGNNKPNCWHNNGDWFYMNGDPITYFGDLGIGIVAANGAYMQFFMVRQDCDYAPFGGSPLNNICAWVRVDANGAKNPNFYGKDIFYVYITENGVKPVGIPGTSGRCDPNSSDPSYYGGEGCAAKVLMNQDY